MNYEVKQLKEKAETAKMMLKYNQISLENAKQQAQPYIDYCNKKAVELAKEFGISPKKVNVSSFLR